MKLERSFTVTSEAELREVIPSPHPDLQNKNLHCLESASQTFMAYAPLLSVSTQNEHGYIDVFVIGDTPGFVHIVDANTLLIPVYADEQSQRCIDNIRNNPFIGTFFIVPGIEEIYRLNGSAQIIDDRQQIESFFPQAPRLHAVIQVGVQESFFHCAKALVRSHFWEAERYVSTNETFLPLARNYVHVHTELNEHSRSFLASAPVLFIGTAHHQRGDASPRGDHTGFVHIIDNKTLLIPDRPGNRLLYNFINIVNSEVAGIVFLVPGTNWVMHVNGKVTIVKEHTLLEPLSVKGKRPALGIWLELEQVTMYYSSALETARLWDPACHVDRASFPSLGKLFMQQMQPFGRADNLDADTIDYNLKIDKETNLY
ncbi:pyridoxamine 5'-phosphate oxidase family protein [Paenibacillus sp. 481]|uniref:pyridoxamine 5'-phosphate oxidase family protein n=1 Tax=Paenibacillus sp. 481 TaxID=2835869 RepID=UPI001E659868|nr:pyridoxamine 5'-phosphate oxidase family protein [Paenibacillus sp. 481]UHA73589.1 pyridoxamine 5'-phosphate oxidase family protein [Paenibacillus sp. 481]